MTKQDSGGADKDDCVFCAIVSGKTNADVVYEGENSVFFYDVSPQAAVHVVGVPRKHITSLATADDWQLLGLLMRDVVLVADKLGLREDGYRVISNVGRNAGQEVDHLHWHILGGEKLGALKC